MGPSTPLTDGLFSAPLETDISATPLTDGLWGGSASTPAPVAPDEGALGFLKQAGSSLLGAGYDMVVGQGNIAEPDKELHPYQHNAWMQRRALEASAQKYVAAGDDEGVAPFPEFLGGDISAKDIRELAVSSGPSLANMLTMAPAGLAATAVGGPLAGYAAAGGAGAVTMQRLGAAHAIREIYNSVNTVFEAENGRSMSKAEFAPIKSTYEDYADKAGWAEAIPETIGQLAGFGLMSAKAIPIVSKLLSSSLKNNPVVSKSVTGAIKILGELFGEVATETGTEVWQDRLKGEAGLEGGDLTIPEAVKRVGKQAVLMSGGMSAAHAGAAKFNPLKTQTKADDEAGSLPDLSESEVKRAPQEGATLPVAQPSRDSVFSEQQARDNAEEALAKAKRDVAFQQDILLAEDLGEREVDAFKKQLAEDAAENSARKTERQPLAKDDVKKVAETKKMIETQLAEQADEALTGEVLPGDTFFATAKDAQMAAQEQAKRHIVYRGEDGWGITPATEQVVGEPVVAEGTVLTEEELAEDAVRREEEARQSKEQADDALAEEPTPGEPTIFVKKDGTGYRNEKSAKIAISGIAKREGVEKSELVPYELENGGWAVGHVPPGLSAPTKAEDSAFVFSRAIAENQSEAGREGLRDRLAEEEAQDANESDAELLELEAQNRQREAAINAQELDARAARLGTAESDEAAAEAFDPGEVKEITADYVEEKYENILSIESELFLSGGFRLTPRGITEEIASAKDPEGTRKSILAEIADMSGELIETARYQSQAEAKNIERTMDYLIRITNNSAPKQELIDVKREEGKQRPAQPQEEVETQRETGEVGDLSPTTGQGITFNDIRELTDHIKKISGQNVEILPLMEMAVDTTQPEVRSKLKDHGMTDAQIDQFQKLGGRVAGSHRTFVTEGQVKSLIQLSLADAKTTTAMHETMHRVFDLALSPQEQTFLLKKYGTIEAIADAYGAKLETLRTRKPVGRVEQLFARVKEVFESVRNFATAKGWNSESKIAREIDAGEYATRADAATETYDDNARLSPATSKDTGDSIAKDSPSVALKYDGAQEKLDGSIAYYQFTIYDGPAKGATFTVKKLDPATVQVAVDKKIVGFKEGSKTAQFDLPGGVQDSDGAVTPQDYIENRKQHKDLKLKAAGSLRRATRDIIKGVDKFLGAVSTRLKVVSPKLAAKVRKLDFDTNTKAADDLKIALPLLRKAKDMTRDDYADWDYARKNSDINKLTELNKKYGMENEYKAVRKMLDSLRDEAIDVGYEVGEINDYWPRVLKDQEGFLSAIDRGTERPVFADAIKKKAEDMGITVGQMDATLKAEIISSVILGKSYGIPGPGSVKQRVFKKIPVGFNKFYMDSDAALTNHIYSMRKRIEVRRFFGKVPDKISTAKTRLRAAEARLRKIKDSGNKDKITDVQDLIYKYRTVIEKYKHQTDFEDNIGTYIGELLAKQEITTSDQAVVKDILTARFNEHGTRGVVRAYKNLSYIDTMGSVISAMTQIGDLAWAAYEGGMIPALKNAYKSVRGKSRITKEDVGVERIAQEFTDADTLGKAVSMVFKVVGLEKIDAIGKESLLNTAFEKYKKEAATSPDQLKIKIKHIFQGETDSVIQDLLANDITDNVKLLVYNRLLDFQPVSLSEMPEKYLTAGNGRLFYMLKTFTLKQFDIYRNEIYYGLRHGNKAKKIEAMRNFIALTSMFVLANAGADELKDWVLGRDTDLGDRVVDNLLRLFGVSKFVTWKARTEGAGSAIARQILPPFKFIDAATKDIVTAGDDKGLYTINSVPVVGKLAYWHMGRGSKIDKMDSKYDEDRAGLLKYNRESKDMSSQEKKALKKDIFGSIQAHSRLNEQYKRVQSELRKLRKELKVAEKKERQKDIDRLKSKISELKAAFSDIKEKGYGMIGITRNTGEMPSIDSKPTVFKSVFDK